MGSGDSPAAQGVQAAFFDVDGTLAATNVVRTYLHFRAATMAPIQRWAWLAQFIPRAFYYAVLDWRSRTRFAHAFFKAYAGVDQKVLETWAEEAVTHYWLPRVYQGALDQIRYHRSQGHHIVILSGGLYPTLVPLAHWLAADALVAAHLEVVGGHYTGRLANGPMTDEAKALATSRLAQSMGLDLQQCYAYADSISDRQLLEIVGHPVAVNPDRPLQRLAQARGWPIRTWRRAREVGSEMP